VEPGFLQLHPGDPTLPRMATTIGSDRAPTRQIGATAVAGLRAVLAGEVITPGDDGYDEHRRVWNGSIDRHPAVIARCADVDDVRAALRFGQDHRLPIAVRSGGHSFPGLSTCDDGLIIDLRQMGGIRVDPDARTAGVQAGVLLGELDAATQEHGLAVPAGIVSHTVGASAGSSASTASPWTRWCRPTS
jgi:FAD/FMN-containing dehydrogenase